MRQARPRFDGLPPTPRAMGRRAGHPMAGASRTSEPIQTRRGRRIRLMSPLGGSDLRLSDAAVTAPLVWSPDGRYLAAERVESPTGLYLIPRGRGRASPHRDVQVTGLRPFPGILTGRPPVRLRIVCYANVRLRRVRPRPGPSARAVFAASPAHPVGGVPSRFCGVDSRRALRHLQRARPADCIFVASRRRRGPASRARRGRRARRRDAGSGTLR